MDVEIREGTPALDNLPVITGIARQAAREIVGREQVVPLRNANMGGEDFAHFLAEVPGCYIRFGARVSGRESFPAHSSRFDFDEKAMAAGAAWFHRVAHLAGARLAAGETLAEPVGEE